MTEDKLQKAREAFYNLHADADISDESDDGGLYYRYLITGQSLRDLLDALEVPQGDLEDDLLDRVYRAIDPRSMEEIDEQRRRQYIEEMSP